MNPSESQPDYPSILFANLHAGYFSERHKFDTWRSRGTKDWLLLVTIGGSGRIHHDDGILHTHRGDVVLYKPNMRQHYSSARSGGWQLLWIHFHPREHWMQWLNWPGQERGFGHLRVVDPLFFRRIERAMRRTLKLAMSDLRIREELGLNALEAVLLWCQAVMSGTFRTDERMLKAAAYISEHASQKLTLSQIADASGQSVSRLTHAFKQQFGFTPHEYAERHRIHLATRLIADPELTFKQISETLGYNSQFHFSRSFRRVTGYSPREYREYRDSHSAVSIY